MYGAFGNEDPQNQGSENARDDDDPRHAEDIAMALRIPSVVLFTLIGPRLHSFLVAVPLIPLYDLILRMTSLLASSLRSWWTV